MRIKCGGETFTEKNAKPLGWVLKMSDEIFMNEEFL